MAFRQLAYLAVALTVSACASPVRVDGIPVYGRLGLLSASDIRAAIAEDRRSPSQPENTIYAVEIMSSSEVHVHHMPWRLSRWAYDEIYRSDGKWHGSEYRVIGGASRID